LHTLGMVYFLQTELGFKNLSLDFQEFPTADKLPGMPYVREYRRAEGAIRMITDDIYTPYSRSSKLYRTSIGIGDANPGQHYDASSNAPKVSYPPMPGYTVPLGSVIFKDIDNLLVTGTAMSVSHLVNASSFYPSVQMTIGQGVGTAAAYCAFFKTTTNKLDVRKVQDELLTHKGYLMPFADVKHTDVYFRAIQQVGASGLLQGKIISNGKSGATVFFLPDSIVKTSEIKPVLLEIYTRSFIWFNKNKPGQVFTTGNLLSFISEMTLADPKTLELNVKKAWKSRYKFTSDFSADTPISRREFAVLVNLYINPFARAVDLTGKLIN
jgi:hypothetical protein